MSGDLRKTDFTHYGSAETFFKNLIEAEEASKFIKISKERLLELAEVGVAPHVRIDGKKILFIKKDLIQWAQHHLLQLHGGREFFRPLIVAKSEGRVSEEELPEKIKGLSRHIKRAPVSPRCCVYFLASDKEVVYVGQAVNLYSRVYEHLRSKSFDEVFFIEVPQNELDATEGAFIRALNPKLNGNLGPISINPKQYISEKYLQ